MLNVTLDDNNQLGVETTPYVIRLLNLARRSLSVLIGQRAFRRATPTSERATVLPPPTPARRKPTSGVDLPPPAAAGVRWRNAADVLSGHKGKANYAFVDGHSELLPLARRFNPPEMNLWSPAFAPCSSAAAAGRPPAWGCGVLPHPATHSPRHNEGMKLTSILCSIVALTVSIAPAQTPIKDVLAQIDPATGQGKAAATEFTVSGIIAARLVLPDDTVVAFVHSPGEPTLPVMTDAKSGEKLLPRNAVKLAGKLGSGYFGANLALTPGSVALTETNKPFASVSVAGALFKDAATMNGRYVQLTNVTFAPGKFDASGKAKVKTADGSEVTLLLSKAAANRDVPGEPTDVFGVITRSGSEWQLVAARFLPVTRKASQELATQRTCLSCHNPDTLQIGPAYREVAAKYRNDPAAINKMVAQMENGGTGKWGTNVMLSLRALVPSADMKTLANWIYSYRWDALLAE